MTKLDLPDGEWALLREARKVPHRLRAPVQAQFMFIAQAETIAKAVTDLGDDVDTDKLTPEQTADIIKASGEVDVLGLMDRLNQTLVMAGVAEWSFRTVEDTMLPVTIDNLLDLPGEAYDALCAACAPMMRDLMPDTSVSPKEIAGTGDST